MAEKRSKVDVRHVAVIMDGNRRSASAQGISVLEGHRAGAKKLKEVTRWCDELRINCLTAYGFSTENWQRSPAEVADLMGLMKKVFSEDIEELHAQGVILTIIGDRMRFSRELQEILSEAEKRTSGNAGLRLYLGLSYGGRQDLVFAFRKLAERIRQGSLNPDQIDETLLSQNLSTAGAPNPDLVIRTGGQLRLSNFLPWETVYSELFFTSTLWPEFTRAEFERIIGEFMTRQRRYGR